MYEHTCISGGGLGDKRTKLDSLSLAIEINDQKCDRMALIRPDKTWILNKFDFDRECERKCDREEKKEVIRLTNKAI